MVEPVTVSIIVVSALALMHHALSSPARPQRRISREERRMYANHGL